MVALLLLGYTGANAQHFNVPLTSGSFNHDIVAEGTTPAGGAPTSTTTIEVDGVAAGANFVFIADNFTFNGTACGTSAQRLPMSGQIVSSNTTNNTGITYQLQGYGSGPSTTNNNTLRLVAGGSGTITPVTPFQASKLFFVGLGGNGAPPFSITVNYTDLTSETIASPNAMPDWCGGAAMYKLPNATTPTQYYRITRAATSCTGTTCQFLYEMPITLSAASLTRTISSITVNHTGSTNTVYLHIMALGAQAPCVAPTAQATGLSLTPAGTGTINGSFTAASPAPTGGYLVVRYPSGSAVTNPTAGTTYTAGNTIGAGTVVSSGTGTTFTASGLSGATTYDFYVYSYATGATCGGPVYYTTTPLTSSATTNACGTMTGTVAVGPGQPNTYPGGFTSLTQALTYINANGLGGNTVLELQAGYDGTSANETFPITFPLNPCVNSAKTLTVRPAAGVTGLTITNGTAAPTMWFNGATYVTVDGRPGGTGSIAFPNSGNLAIISTNTAVNSVAVKLSNEATNNTVQYCDLQGANSNNITSTVQDCGVVLIAGTTGLNGNDNNTISYCNIHEAAAGTLPALGILSYGYTGTSISTSSTLNDNNTVSNCNIYNYFNAGNASAGIQLDRGTNAWTISNNKLFQTATRTFTAAVVHRGFWITPSSGGGGNGFVITNNYIGGNDPSATGSYTLAGAFATAFWGMDLSVIGSVANVPATASTVQGNTISMINYTANAGTTNDWFRGISIGSSGNVNVATNNIGSGTGTGAIALSNSGTTTGVQVYGIKTSSTSGVYTIISNVVGSMTMTGTSNSPSTQFTGIGITGGGTLAVNHNTIGSATTNNSIQLPTPSTATTAQSATGILVSNGTTISAINGNTIGNLTNAYNGTASAGQVRGIAITSSTPALGTINNNIIKNLLNAAPNTNSGTSSAVMGISQNNSNAAGCTLNGNVIDSLVSTAATGSVYVTGLYYGGTATVTNSIAKNFIHSLSALTTGTGGAITGIDNAGGANNFVNNMISLGYKADGTPMTTGMLVRGISSNSGSATNVYYNSIYIGGSGVANTSNTFAFTRTATSGTYNFRNNIFANTRSFTATGSTGNYGLYFTTSNAGASVNYNLYYAPGTGGYIGYTGTANQTAYASNWISGDANSQSGDPLFLAPTGVPSAINLHLTAGGNVAESGGVAIAGFNDDFDGDIRQGSAGYSGTGTAPDLGADEFVGAAVVPVIASTSINPPATTITCAGSAAHTVTANITATGAAITSVVINYAVNGVAQAPITMSLSSGTGAAGTTSTYTGTIPVVSPANATVVWSVTASTGSSTASSANASYQDAPLSGVGAVASATPTTFCAGNSTTLSAVLGGSFTQPFNSFPLTNFTVSGTNATAVQSTTYSTEGGSSVRFNTTSVSATALLTQNTNLDLTQYGTAQLTFDHQTLMEGPSTSYDYGYVEYSVDGGANWVTFPAGSYTGSSLLYSAGQRFSTRSYNDWIAAFTGTGSLPSNTLWKTETFNIPTAALTNQFRLRFRYTTDGSTNYYGWMIDNVKIANPTTVTSISWSNGASTVGTGSPLTVSPTTSTNYTATITASGCTVNTNTVAVTVNPAPTVPVATNSSQCGTQVPTASVADPNGFATPTFKWYAAMTGGTALQSSTATTYGTAVSSTTTFYVSVTNPTTGCESNRSAVTVTVTSPDAVAASANGSTTPAGGCINVPVSLSAAQTGNNNNYTYTWTASPQAGSGLPVGGTTGQNISVTPTAGGTFTYTVTAVDGSCTTTSGVSITISNPFAGGVSASATPATVCAGSNVTLNALVITPGGTATVGTNGTTIGVSNSESITPFSQYFESQHTQFLVTASALTSAGLGAGNVTGLKFNITTKNSTLPYTNYAVKMANTSTTALANGNTAATFTNVYSNASLTTTAGLNTLTFSTPFNWDGTSNVLVDVCFANDPAGAGTFYTLNDIVAATTTAYVSTAGYYQDNINLCGTTSTNALTASKLPDMVFVGNAQQPATVSNWVQNSNSASLGSGNPKTANPTATTTYTATITASGCTTTATTAAVTVNPLPTAPNGTNSSQCGTQVPTASVADPNGFASPTFKWYAASTGGTALQSSTATTYGTAVSSTTTFHVSVTNPTTGCESNRTPVTVTIVAADAITARANGTTTPATACPNVVVALSNTQTGSNNTYTSYTWTASPATGSGLASPSTGSTGTLNVTPTAAGTYTYSLSATDGSCTAVSSVTITIAAPPSVNNVTATPGTTCSGGAVVLSAQSVSAVAGNTTVGTVTGQYGGDGGFPYRQGAAAGNKVEILYTAAELTAAGLTTGNITSLGFNVTAAGTGTMNNLTIKMDATSATAVTSTYNPASVTTVFGPVNYTATTGVNTHTLSTPFFWNGTSNVVVTVCHDVVSGGTSSTMDYTATTNMSATNTSTSPSTCGLPTGTVAAYRPVTRFGGQVGTNVTSSMNFVWNPGNLSGSSVTVNPTNATASDVTNTYTVTVTNPTTTCSNTGTVNVTVRPAVTAPVATNSSQCGTQVPTASVADPNGFATPTFKWYAASTGGTALQSSTSHTYTTAVSATTTFYVSVTSPASGCESNRSAVTVTVTTPDAISAKANGASSVPALCLGAQVALSNTQTGSNNTYTSYTWSASPATGSGLASPSTASTSNLNITPTAVGTYTYTLTATDGTCTTTSTATVTVTDPFYGSAPVATASASAVCNGSAVTLTASAINPGGNASVGTNNTTMGVSNSDNALSPFSQYYESQHSQYLITASALTAANLTAGNITGLKFNVTTKNSTLPYTNYAVKMANTSTTALAAANTAGTFTNVYSNASLTTATGLNTLTFSTPFNWDGTSNVLVDVCFANDPTGGGGTLYSLNDIVAATNTAYVATAGYFQDNTNLCGTTSANTITASKLPDMVLVGNVAQVATSAIWSNGATTVGSSNPQSVTPVNNTTAPTTVTYTATVTQGGCTRQSNPVTVTVNPTGQWLGITNNWNTATNWCGGVPTASSDVIIPSAAAVPASPTILTNNSGTVHNIQLNNGSVLTVESDATLNLYGNVSVTGTGTLSADEGTVNFAGTAAQMIMPGFTTGTLTISGGSVKNLAGDVTVNSALLFSNGMIDVGSHALIMANTAEIINAGSTRYVRTSAPGGRLSRAVGSVDVEFPVGNSSYNPATLTNTGTADVFSVGVRDQVLQDGTNGAPVNSSTTYVVNRTWDISEAVAGGSNVTLALQWNAGEVNSSSFDYSHVYISHYTGGSYDLPYTYAFQAPAAGGTGPYYTSRENITSFSPFTIGSAGGAAPLPVTLVRLEASNEGTRNKVEWESATEHDLASYIVERSTDGKTFTRMDEVTAAGKAQGYITYDNNPAQGLTHYRLKMMDHSGAFVYSQTVHAFMGRTGEVVVTAQPNPLRDVLTVNVYGAQDGQAQLTDVSGRVVASVAVQNGQATFNTSALSAGTYFMKWSNGTAAQTIKVTKQ